MIVRVAIGHIFETYYGRSPHSESIVTAWLDCANSFNNLELDFGSQKVRFVTDWSDIATHNQQSIQKNHDFWNCPDSDERDRILKACREFNGPSHLDIEVSFANEESHKSTSFVEIYLSLVFLALNLAAPGSAHFESFDVVDEKHTHRMHLHPYWLDLAPNWSDKHGWPKLHQISVQQVRDWILAIGAAKIQVAEDRAIKALFAILNQAKSHDAFSSILWSAVILETLFDSRREAVFESLRNRIFTVLGQPTTHERKIRKALSEFYSLRSGIVHGSFQVAHPSHVDFIDSRVDEHMSRIWDGSHIAQAITVSTLQLMISNNWKGICFEEKAVGIQIDG